MTCLVAKPNSKTWCVSGEFVSRSVEFKRLKLEFFRYNSVFCRVSARSVKAAMDLKANSRISLKSEFSFSIWRCFSLSSSISFILLKQCPVYYLFLQASPCCLADSFLLTLKFHHLSESLSSFFFS